MSGGLGHSLLVPWWLALIRRAGSRLFVALTVLGVLISRKISSSAGRRVISCLVLVRAYGNLIWYVVSQLVLEIPLDECANTGIYQGPEDLFETISQALLNAVDRDALSGWGAHVYVIEKDKVTKRLLKGRQD
jgi:hypothetical protein